MNTEAPRAAMHRFERILFVSHHRKFKTFARSRPWARELASRGHRVTLMCVSDRARFRLREYEQEGIHWVETPDLLPGRLRSGWDPWSILRRRRYLRHVPADLVHAFESRPATIHPVRSYLRRSPCAWLTDWNDWWGRGGLITEQRPRWYQWLMGGVETFYEEHFRPQSLATTVISEALGRRAVALGVPPERVHWIPGGADTERFVPEPAAACRPRHQLPLDAFIVCFAALDVTTDLPVILDAVALAARQVPKLLLVVTGRPPPGWADALACRGLAGRTRHFGVVDYAVLPSLLACADVFLLPFRESVSNRGRWPNKIGDYLATGRPTITNPVGEMRRLFEVHRVGLLTAPSPEPFADAIEALHRDAGWRTLLGENARRLAEREFAWPRIVDRLELCYGSLPARDRD